ncbi:substrate-binding domain-containing protein [Streptomyces sp. NPDC090741]|uniref:substrate-binding domain-containing protein n=1 Tax=Streptomyces sp. NPDC090741 TaxID=3365967 RepID=UPI003818549B
MDNDHEAATREVLDHLAAAGATRIALHSAYGREYCTEAATSAYTRWCAERGAQPLVVPFDPEDTPGHAFDPVFAGPGRPRPDAVYCVYDPGGRQVLAAAARHGLRIPHELLLVRASEDPSYAAGDPPVSTVTLRPEVIGESAVAALVALLESPEAAAPGRLTVPAALTVRTSSRTPPRADAGRPSV